MAGNLRHDAKRDRNEPEILRAIEAAGAHWERYGPLDIWCCAAGVWTAVEIKDPKRKGHADEFTDTQLKFIEHCHYKNLPYQVWYSVDDALDWVKSLTRQRVG